MTRYLINFELKNILLRKKTKVVLLVLLLILTGMYSLHKWIEKNDQDTKTYEIEYAIESLQNAIKTIPSDTDDEGLKKILNQYNLELDMRKEQLEAYSEGEWKITLEKEIEIDQSLLTAIRNNMVFSGESPETIESRIMQNQEFLNRNIQPALPEPTEGFYFLKSFLNFLFSIVGFLLLIFLISDSLAHDIEKRTIRLLLAQGISRTKIFISKFFVAIGLGICVMIGASIIAFIFGALFSGIGSSKYPVLIILDGLLGFVDIYSLLISGFVLFSLVLMMGTSLMFLLSVITNSSTVSTSVTAIIALTFAISISQLGYFGKIAHIIPFSYINTFSIIDGSLATSLENNSLTFNSGIITLLTTSLIFFIASFILMKRKDFY